MKKVLLIILVLIFTVGCEKQIEVEVPIQEIPTEPEKPVEPEVPDEPEVPVEPEVPDEPEPLKFISDITCDKGNFNFTVTNIGDEDLQTIKISMFIKGKLFRPPCDKETIAPNESTICSQSYYLNVEGPTQTVIQAKMGKLIEKYAEAVEC